MRITLRSAVLSLLLSAVGGCHGDNGGQLPLGGQCGYRDVPGIATIVAVRDASPDDYNCQNAVTVVFDFAPADSAAIHGYLFPAWPDSGRQLRVGSGLNPPRSWVEGQGLAEGTQHRCTRQEITVGTCTPVLFTFPDIDFSGWADSCFSR